VVDASGDFERRIAAVRRVLEEIGLAGTPELLVFNKIDRLPPGVGRALAERHGAVAVSALGGAGLDALLERAEAMLPEAHFDEGAAFWPQSVAVGGGSE
jgi:GTP-binding protein HflX